MHYSDSEWKEWLANPVTQEFINTAKADIAMAKELLTEEEADIKHARLRGIIAGLRALLGVIPEHIKEYEDGTGK